MIHPDYTGPRSNLTPGQAAFRHWFFENDGTHRLANAHSYSPRKKRDAAALRWLREFWWRIQYEPNATPPQRHFEFPPDA
jgi:hypothetical protein